MFVAPSGKTNNTVRATRLTTGLSTTFVVRPGMPTTCPQPSHERRGSRDGTIVHDPDKASLMAHWQDWAMNAMTRPVTTIDRVWRQRDRVARHELDPGESHLRLCRACGRPWPCEVVGLLARQTRG